MSELSRIKQMHGFGLADLRANPETFIGGTIPPIPPGQSMVFVNAYTSGIAVTYIDSYGEIIFGRRVRFINRGTDTVTFNHTAVASRAKGLMFLNNGAANRDLGTNDQIELWQDVDGFWFEIGYLNV